MGHWRSPSFILLMLFSCESQARRNVTSNVCKWCDNTYPVCEDQVCYSNCDLSSYCEKPEEICVSIWKQDNESIRVSTLCHNPQYPVENVMVPKYNTSQCVMVRQHTEDGIFYICGCVNEQECNDKLVFKNQTNGYSMLQSKEIIPVAAISLLPPLLVAIMITVIFYLCRTHRQRKRSKDWTQKQTQHHMLPESSRASNYDEILSVKTDNHPALNSACASNINHNTELLPIELDERVGKGQFAEVWRAKLKHASSGQYETVAVKIFPCEEYASWKNESQIFTNVNLKHGCILQFLTAEERHSGLQKEYWLITAYHSHGNLKDYLSRHILSWRDLLKMAGSLVSGVAHLHSDYTPCGSPKIPIAHRDIKSTNILVTNEHECVLCDFGIALRLDPALSVEDFANSGQVGTARYMAPEVLESRVNLEDLESFKQMDVYSMALVLWEIASRCEAIGEVKNYELPFGSKVQEQLCMEVMRDIVLHGRGRPEIPSNWLIHQGWVNKDHKIPWHKGRRSILVDSSWKELSHLSSILMATIAKCRRERISCLVKDFKGMHFLSDTIIECWDHDPEARLTAHCVAERFNLMAQMDCDDILNNNHHHNTDSEASKLGCPREEHQNSDRNMQ